MAHPHHAASAPPNTKTLSQAEKRTRGASVLCVEGQRSGNRGKAGKRLNPISTGTSLLKNEKEGKQVHPEILVNGASQQF